MHQPDSTPPHETDNSPMHQPDSTPPHKTDNSPMHQPDQVVVPHLVAEALVAAIEQDGGTGRGQVRHVEAVVTFVGSQVLRKAARHRER